MSKDSNNQFYNQGFHNHINVPNSFKLNSLHKAVENEDEYQVEEILRNGGYVNSINEHNQTPLHIAAIKNNSKIIELLIKYKVDVHARDRNGNTPLDLILRNDPSSEELEVAKLFIKYGADVNSRNNGGIAIIFDAAAKNDTDLIDLLVDNGADVNIKCINDNHTPLHLAALNSSNEAISLLIECGADIHARDNDGNTLLHYAINEDGGNVHTIELLCSLGSKIDAQNNDGDTAPHLLLDDETLRPEVLATLLNLGADIHVKNKIGITPVNIGFKKLKNGQLTPLDSGLSKNKDGILSILNSALLADSIYKGDLSDIDKYLDDTKIEHALSRLENRVKSEGFSIFLHNANNIDRLPESIRDVVKNLISSIRSSDEDIAKAIEGPLAEILFITEGDKFLTSRCYSSIHSSYITEKDKEIISKTIDSYKQEPHYIPQNFLNYMINPKNRKTILAMLFHCSTQAEEIFKGLDKLILSTSQKKNLQYLEEEFKSPFSQQSINHYLSNDLAIAQSSTTYLSEELLKQEKEINELESQLKELLPSVSAERQNLKRAFGKTGVSAKLKRIKTESQGFNR